MSNAGYGNHDEAAPPKARGGALTESEVVTAGAGGAETPREPDAGISTPGDGAGAKAPVGHDVDPGVG